MDEILSHRGWEMRIYVATKNKHKLKEISSILSGYEVVTFNDMPDIDETGSTFEENAAIKAADLSKLVDGLVIADDSGIAVDALNGRPGIHSARYSGVHGDDIGNTRKLLDDMRAIENRSAQFVCAIALAEGGEILHITKGIVEGVLAYEPKGSNGFGYDPIFITESGKSMAELSSLEKNVLSHRRKALVLLKDFMENNIG